MEKEVRVVIFEDNQHYRDGIVAVVDVTPPFKIVGAFPDCSKLIQRIEQLRPDIILMDMKLFVYLFDMGVYRFFADETGVGDRFVSHALYKAFQDFLFAFTEVNKFRRC